MALTKVSYSLTEGAPANVLDYGADPTGVNDSTDAFDQAIATGKRVRVPAGTYKCNVTINNKTIIEGDGSTVSIVKPYDDSVAVMTYTFTAQQNPLYRYWDYHSEVRNIGFFSNATQTGVGFTFGKTNPADYQTNDEYANNVKFYGCYFEGFDKGLQFPFGNIGTEIYSCGFASNKYGVYTLNNKFGGMHAGCKYFYGGEFHSNDCAFYCHNTADGFGAVSFTGPIFEANALALYVYSTSDLINSISLESVWFESNSSASVVIDSWSGSAVTPQTVIGGNTIFDGTRGSYQFTNSFFTDCQLKASYATVIAENSRCESKGGVGGKNSLVTGENSSIIQNNCYSDNGPSVGTGIYSTGFTTIVRNNIEANPTTAGGNWFNVIPRSSKAQNYGPSLKASVPFTSAESTTGSFGLTGSVVSDGQIYSTCNEYTRSAFLSNEYTAVINSYITLVPDKYYVYTFDAKVTVGGVHFRVWNRSTAQFSTGLACPTLGRWYSFAAIGKATNTNAIFLDCRGANVDATWRLSAFQIHQFDSFTEAKAFLQSGVFAES